MAVSFQNQGIDFILKDKLKTKTWIKKIIENEKKEQGQINFVFTTDDEVLKANIQFLNHNTYTDIITFDYCRDNKINGDVLISVERVMENAKKFDTDFESEIKRVIIHGVLHLCGYKDKSKADIELMRGKENEALKLYQIQK